MPSEESSWQYLASSAPLGSSAADRESAQFARYFLFAWGAVLIFGCAWWLSLYPREIRFAEGVLELPLVQSVMKQLVPHQVYDVVLGASFVVCALASKKHPKGAFAIASVLLFLPAVIW